MKKKIIIYGASGYCKNIIKSLDDYKYEILAIVDRKREIQGTIWNGVKIISPDKINSYSYDCIIISVAEYENEIKESLAQQNVDMNKVEVYNPNTKCIEWEDIRVAMLRICIDEIKRKGLRGSMAEVGVYKGDFAKYMNRYLPEHKLYLFDTFNGFASEDIAKEAPLMEANSNFFDGNEKIVKDKMINANNCIIKKGYFPETATDVPDNFCLVSLDADLYQPIKSGLEFFYPRLEQGGYIFVHDYGTLFWPGVKKAVEEYCDQNKISYIPIMDRCLSVIITK